MAQYIVFILDLWVVLTLPARFDAKGICNLVKTALSHKSIVMYNFLLQKTQVDQSTTSDDGSEITIMTTNDYNINNNIQSADVIYAGYGDDIIFGDMGDFIFAEEGDHIIDMPDTFNFNDILVDTGEGMDVLLIGAANLYDAKSMLGTPDITNTEIIIVGDNIKGGTAEEIFTEININTNGNMYELSSSNWAKVTSSDGYTELTKTDDTSITILVETVKLNFC